MITFIAAFWTTCKCDSLQQAGEAIKDKLEIFTATSIFLQYEHHGKLQCSNWQHITG